MDPIKLRLSGVSGFLFIQRGRGNGLSEHSCFALPSNGRKVKGSLWFLAGDLVEISIECDGRGNAMRNQILTSTPIGFKSMENRFRLAFSIDNSKTK